MAFRWNGAFADAVASAPLDLTRQPREAGFAGPVLRNALFGAFRVSLGGAGVLAVADVSGTLVSTGTVVITGVVFPAGPADPPVGQPEAGATWPGPARSSAQGVDRAGAWATLRASSRGVLVDRSALGALLSWPEGTRMLYRKQGDSGGEVVLQVARKQDGVAAPAPELADAVAVRLRRRSPSGVIVRTPMVVDDLARGLVSAPLELADLAEPGTHALLVEVEGPAGELTTFPYQGHLTLVVEPLP